ncbi:MAG: terminase small subunit [Candidatus Pacebacteria bacterium]|nr:terminase small subunit [Candidatus Paceibacterota bacterium]
MNKSFYKKQFLAKDIIKALYNEDKRVNKGKNKPLKLFSCEEFAFLRGLIFGKGNKNTLFLALDHISERHLQGFGFSNTASLRRILFFQYYLSNNGNAAKAAILAGYSPKAAKQQGYRILKWIQKELSLE